MDRRAATESVARNVCSVIAAAGTSPESVASATDVTLSSLYGQSEMALDELVTVGGLFRVPVGSLLEVNV